MKQKQRLRGATALYRAGRGATAAAQGMDRACGALPRGPRRTRALKLRRACAAFAKECFEALEQQDEGKE